MDEVEEWEKFRRGSGDAFKNIYRRFAAILYNYGSRFSSDSELVEDNIQDLFIELWESKERLSPTTSVKYYLLRALRRRIAKESAIRKRFGFELDDANTPFSESYEFQLIIEQEDAAKKRVLDQALALLSARQREILHLKYYDELSFEEIALVMQIDIKSAYKLTYKALASIKERLARKGAIIQITFIASGSLLIAALISSFLENI